MHESLHSVHPSLFVSPPVSRSGSRGRGRGKAAPFTLNEDPPTDGTGEEGAGSEEAPCPPRGSREVSSRLDDEEGQTLDVTA